MFIMFGTSVIVSKVKPILMGLVEEAYKAGLEAMKADQVDLGMSRVNS